MSESELDMERLKSACGKLIEHFDTVHIFCTRHESSQGGTVNANYGLGNWFARKGQVSEWVLKESESTRSEVRRREDEDES